MIGAQLDAGKILAWHGQVLQSPAARAGLRRSRDLNDLLLDRAGAEAFMRLVRAVNPDTAASYPLAQAVPLARAALAVAEVKEDIASETFGGRCAATDGGRPLLSKDRFRLLMSAEDAMEFLRLLRSAIGQAQGRAPVRDVFFLAHGWGRPERRAKMRRDQLLTYYAKLPASELKEP